MIPFRAALAAAVLALASAGTASAATVDVNPGGNDGTCAPGGTACRTVAQGVTVAGAGDTVDVAPGTYVESQVLITKPLTLTGAGADQTTIQGAPGGPSGTPGIIRFTPSGSGALKVSGFTIRGVGPFTNDGVDQVYLAYGFDVPSTIAVTFSDNVFDGTGDPNRATNYINGLYDVLGGGSLTVTGNTFHDVFQAFFREAFTGATTVAGNTFTSLIASDGGPGNGGLRQPNGVFMLQDQGAANTAAQRIDDNAFTDFAGTAVGLQAFGSGVALTNVGVTGNTFDVDGVACSGCPDGHSPDGITINGFNDGTVSGVTITGNSIAMGAPSRAAILVRNGTGNSGSTNGVFVRDNELVGAPDYGLWNDTTADIDARENWWGCNEGPTRLTTPAPGRNAAGCTTILDDDTGVTSFDPFAKRLAPDEPPPATTTTTTTVVVAPPPPPAAPPATTATTRKVVCAGLPNLAGHTARGVRVVLKENGCARVAVRIRTDTKRKKINRPRGQRRRVTRQSPKPGTILRQGATVTVYFDQERYTSRVTLPVVYDSDCGFCRRALAKLLAADRGGRLRPVALGTEEADALLASVPPAERPLAAHAVTPDGRVWSGGDAVAPILAWLGHPRWASVARRLALPLRLGYRVVAANRGALGRFVSS